MNRLILKIEDNNNYLNLLNLLKHLDFVQIEQQEEEDQKALNIESVFGIWKDSEIDIESIRSKAWKKEQ